MKSLIHENPSIHKCHAEKALEVSKYSSDELESEKSQALERLNYFFSPLVIGIAWLAMTTTMTIYLNVEEIDLVPQRQSSYYTSFAFASSSKRRNGVTNLGDDKRAQEINGREQHEEQRLVPRAIEENCIDLRHVNSIENSHWTYRAINGHGKRSIAINAGELNDFVRTTKATFGTFKVQMKDDVASSYFFMYFSCS